MRLMEKKVGLILGGILLFSLVLVVGVVMAVTQTQATTATVTVNTFLSVTLSNNPVEFVNMNPGQTLSATVDKGFPLTATIGAESNVNPDVGTSANQTNFGGPATLAVSNLEWATDSGFTTPVDYTTSDANVCSNVAPGDPCNIFHRLTIPSNQAAGDYNIGITVSATA